MTTVRLAVVDRPTRVRFHPDYHREVIESFDVDPRWWRMFVASYRRESNPHVRSKVRNCVFMAMGAQLRASQQQESRS